MPIIMPMVIKGDRSQMGRQGVPSCCLVNLLLNSHASKTSSLNNIRAIRPTRSWTMKKKVKLRIDMEEWEKSTRREDVH
jgi:hypothetical protein